jgi:hypothetical protein
MRELLKGTIEALHRDWIDHQTIEIETWGVVVGKRNILNVVCVSLSVSSTYTYMYIHTYIQHNKVKVEATILGIFEWSFLFNNSCVSLTFLPFLFQLDIFN